MLLFVKIAVCVSFMCQDHNCTVRALATDRHPTVQKIMRESYPEVQHEFDLWHIVKGLKKKLLGTKNKELVPWVRSISNHLWYCAAVCNGDATRLKETWMGILHHVTNEHIWVSGEKVNKCGHEPYSQEEALKRPWIAKKSKAFELLQKFVLDKRLLKDLEKVIIVIYIFCNLICLFGKNSNDRCGRENENYVRFGIWVLCT